jgi:hypothetical protein
MPRLGAAWLPTWFRNRAGYATVELAIAIPLLLMMTTLCLWSLSLTVLDIRLNSSAASAARILARGQTLPPAFSNSLPSNTHMLVFRDQSMVRVDLEVRVHSPIPRFPIPWTIHSSATAAMEDVGNGS